MACSQRRLHNAASIAYHNDNNLLANGPHANLCDDHQ